MGYPVFSVQKVSCHMSLLLSVDLTVDLAQSLVGQSGRSYLGLLADRVKRKTIKYMVDESSKAAIRGTIRLTA